MCELLGVSGAEKIECNDLLRTFFTHAADNPDGWGLARFYGNGVSLEKEPVSALESVYLRNRLTDVIREDVLITHIRKASVGGITYRNCHPFAMRDDSGRLWTLAHNGTIFESPDLERWARIQNGSTDSERILYHLVDRINEKLRETGMPLDAEARFSVAEDMVCRITPKNMVNLLIYDGELLYTHANREDSLHLLREKGRVVISSKPLSQGGWETAPLNVLLAFHRGELVNAGKDHGNKFVKSGEDPA